MDTPTPAPAPGVIMTVFASEAMTAEVVNDGDSSSLHFHPTGSPDVVISIDIELVLPAIDCMKKAIALEAARQGDGVEVTFPQGAERPTFHVIKGDR